MKDQFSLVLYGRLSKSPEKRSSAEKALKKMITLNPDYPPKEFNEKTYLEFNPDVFEAVQKGDFSSGWEHFYIHGYSENRPGISNALVKSIKEIYNYEDTSLIPPEAISSHDVGSGDFISVGEHILDLLINVAGLQPSDRVFDVGCGIGRVARPLTRYITSGTYTGLDIISPSMDWCQEAYSKQYPNFSFQYADIYNKMYNPEGEYQPHEYCFPFEDASFNFIFLTSVFTHMLPPGMENYLSEISRVLAPNGTCFASFYLLNPSALELIEEKSVSFSFPYELPGCKVEDLEIPENVVAFSEDRIRELYQKYRLEIIEPVRHGKWCGRQSGLSYQDIIIAKKMS